MNNKFENLLIIFIMIIALVFANIPTSEATITATVNANSVRVRQEATTESEIIEIASEGEEVEIIEKVGDWYKVRYNRKEGYIRGDLLDIIDDTEITNNTNTDDEETNLNNSGEEPNTNTDGQTNENQEPDDASNVIGTGISTIKLGQNVLNEGDKIVISNDVNLKILPLVNSSNIVSISANTEVTVTEIVNSWCKIETEEQAGWLRIEK